MLDISATHEWELAHPGATIGLLEISGIDNSRSSAILDERKRETEVQLREQYKDFKRADFLALPVMAAYDQYYKRFNKTYHVQLQLESIVLKGKSLPNVSPAVDLYFMAEVETLILTAGHDAKKLNGPLLIDVSNEGDVIRQMNGENKPIRAGDMVMRDAENVRCSIIYGQDGQSLISADSSHILYVAYAPAGIPAAIVEDQLRKIEETIRSFSPQAVVEQNRLLSAILTD
jgi:DNA/RNA-binding domain of Phe-tRNA-synthetase-like protein